MSEPIYVIGHRNPDSDAICAVIGYTALMHLQGHPEAVASRQGPVRRETAYILNRFGVEQPVLVTDVRPRVADVMTKPATCISPDAPLIEAGRLLESRNLRVVPVADDSGKLLGVSGIADLATAFITGLEEEMSPVPLQVDNLLRTLSGEVLVEAPRRELRDRLMVGAMKIESMVQYLEPDVLLVIGDRHDAQLAALEAGVGGLVITGGSAVHDDIVEIARQRGVWVITSPHHTYHTLRLIELSVPVRHVMRTDVQTCHPDELTEEVQEQLQSGPTRSLVVVDENRQVQGIISRSNLLRTVRRRVVLIDHNERGQAVTGVEEADVMAVIDHHRVADFWTRNPPYMRLEPVGATSTIVGKLFDEARVALSPKIAGVLLGGILADTLLFRGPTTTAEDRRVAQLLAAVAGVEIAEFGQEILALQSDVSGRSAHELLTADFKDFSVDGCEIGIGTIETTNAGPVLRRENEMLQAMDSVRQQGYTVVLFAIIDIVQEKSTILVSGNAAAVAAAFDTVVVGEHLIEIPRILSRKKDIVPLLGTVCKSIGSSR